MPGPKSRSLARDLSSVEPPPLFGAVDGSVPIAWERSRGAHVVDVDGNRYVDLTGGFGAALVGHRNPRVVRAIQRVSERLIHGLADAAPHPDRAALAHTLSERGPVRNGRVMFAVSGADAVEIALETAHLATGNAGVVAFDLGYHGTSLGARRVTGRRRFREPFEEVLEPMTLRVPFAHCFRCAYRLSHPACGIACLDAALAEIDAWNGDASRPRIGAWIVEPIVGREGIVVPPPGFLRRLGRAARARGILVVADEILTGGGRTGRMWASKPLQPDLVTIGKGITGGLPLAAVVGKKRLLSAWDAPGEARRAATFMANPVAVAATRAALVEIERKDLPSRAREIGKLLRAGLRRIARAHGSIGEIRGVGAMWGVDVVVPSSRAPDPDRARRLSAALAEEGYLALAGGAAGNVLVLTPPLTITERQIDGFVSALDVRIRDE